jgi:broad specificity phosphatase PhoE
LKLTGYGIQCIFSSQEPKAAETAEILAAELKQPWQTLPNLHEHVRPISTNFNQAAFEADVRSLFAQPNVLVFGSETADQAHERFRRAVEGIVEVNSGKNTAIVAHGTVISLFVSRACGMEPFALWKSLGLPSCVIIDQETGEVIDKI